MDIPPRLPLDVWALVVEAVVDVYDLLALCLVDQATRRLALRARTLVHPHPLPSNVLHRFPRAVRVRVYLCVHDATIPVRPYERLSLLLPCPQSLDVPYSVVPKTERARWGRTRMGGKRIDFVKGVRGPRGLTGPPGCGCGPDPWRWPKGLELDLADSVLASRGSMHLLVRTSQWGWTGPDDLVAVLPGAYYVPAGRGSYEQSLYWAPVVRAAGGDIAPRRLGVDELHAELRALRMDPFFHRGERFSETGAGGCTLS